MLQFQFKRKCQECILKILKHTYIFKLIQWLVYYSFVGWNWILKFNTKLKQIEFMWHSSTPTMAFAVFLFICGLSTPPTIMKCPVVSNVLVGCTAVIVKRFRDGDKKKYLTARASPCLYTLHHFFLFFTCFFYTSLIPFFSPGASVSF